MGGRYVTELNCIMQHAGLSCMTSNKGAQDKIKCCLVTVVKKSLKLIYLFCAVGQASLILTIGGQLDIYWSMLW